MNKIYFLLLIVILVSSCKSNSISGDDIDDVYLSSEEEKFDVEFSFDLDTFFVRKDKDYNDRAYQFAYNVISHKVNKVSLYEGNNIIQSSSLNIDTFYLSPQLVSTFHYKSSLKIKCELKTNSGSVADKYNKEHFLVEKEWPLIRDDYRSRFISTSIKEGYLNVKWEKYKGLDFKEYVLCKWNYDTIAIITDLNKLGSIDSSYIAFGRGYRLFTVTAIDTLESRFRYSDKNAEPKVIAQDYIFGNTISWERPVFHKGIDKYRLYEGFSFPNDIHFIGEVDANTYSFNHYSNNFASDKKFFVHPVARYLPEVYPEFNERWNPFRPGVFEMFEFCLPGLDNDVLGLFCNSKGDVYATTFNDLYRMDSNHDLEIISNGSESFQDLSPSCKYYLTTEDGVARLYLTEDKSLVSEYALNTIVLDDPRFELRDVSISDKGIVAFAFDQIYVVDMLNNIQLATVRLNEFYYDNDLRISPDGKYISFRDYYESEKRGVVKLIEITSKGISPSKIEINSIYRFYFDWTDPEMYYYFNDGSLITGSKLNNSVKSIYVGDDLLFSIDFYKREFLTVNIKEREFRIYDLDSGIMMHTLDIGINEMNGLMQSDNYILCNHYIVGPTMMKLEY